MSATNYSRDLDLFAELGTERINTVSMDPDLERTCAEFEKLAELVAERGMRITTELAPTLTINTLPTRSRYCDRSGALISGC